jgi:NADH-quinone oxidoreductase subunit K
MTIPLEGFLIVSGLLFCLGILCVVIRRNAINVLMGVELIFNSANLNLVAFARYGGVPLPGQLFAVFVIMIAAAEVSVALAIVIMIYKHFRNVNLDSVQYLKW